MCKHHPSCVSPSYTPPKAPVGRGTPRSCFARLSLPLLALLAGLLMPLRALGEDARGLHDVAHFGIGYAANTAAYAVFKTITGEKEISFGYAFLATSLLALGKEVLIDRRFSPRDAGMGILGAAGSSLTLFVIEVD